MSKEKFKIEQNQNAWNQLMDLITNSFKKGELISHGWLKKNLLIDEIKPDQFESLTDLLKAIELQQFEYMYLIDKLRWDLLERSKCYLKNIKGEGYTILPPKDHVDYAYKKAMREIKSALKESFLMMDNVDVNDIELRNKNTANKMKLSMLRQFVLK